MNTLSKILVTLIFMVMFSLMFASSWNESATFDESSHIGAGYSYVTQKDMRLNPEHPPLWKDISGLATLLTRANYRTDTNEWREGVNEQWAQGSSFLYNWGNNPDRILHYSRFPTILLAIILGIILFSWIRGLYGNKIALLATFFYAFSPTVIAHSRLVTTDTAAAFGFLIGIISFLKFLARPTKKRLLLAGIVFGIVQSLKFSLFLLIPMYLFLAFAWLLSNEDLYDMSEPRNKRVLLFFKNAFRLYSKIGVIFVLGAIIVWSLYAWNVWNYPQEKQISDAKILLGTFRVKPLVSLDIWLIDHRITRPLGHYLMGLMMVTQRTAGGNTAYFLGEVSADGWWYYFPTAYILKEALGFHLLTTLAFLLAIRRILKAKDKSFESIRGWTQDNFPVFASLFIVIFYWLYSMANPLNIGVRHMLPTFPFIYLLVSREIIIWISGSMTVEVSNLREWLRSFYRTVLAPAPKLFFLFLSLAWISSSVVANFPNYISYFNEIAGGTKYGYRYITDSNYDWGQDLKRLKDFLQKYAASEQIYLSYFGGGSPKYYLGEKYVDWWSSKGPPPSGSLFAISINTLQGDHFAKRKPNVSLKYEDTYPWLSDLEPFGRAGTSIFLYRIP